jgi:hypothetical protein
MALSLYDKFDQEYINKNANYITGLVISNVVPIFATGFANSIEVKNDLRFVNNNNYGNQIRMQINNVSGTGSHRLVAYESDKQVIFMSRK